MRRKVRIDARLASLAVPVEGTTTAPRTVAAAAAAERSPLTLTLAHHASRGLVGSLLLDVGGRDNLSGEVEQLAQVVETLGGEGVVVVWILLVIARL